MKKIVIALLLAAFLVSPCSAESLFDKIVYKNVFLKATQQHVLVNRITSEVKYVVLNNGKMIAPKGPSKLQFQAMYDLQRKQSSE